MSLTIDTIYRCRIEVTSPFNSSDPAKKMHRYDIACTRMSDFETSVERLCRARGVEYESGNTACLNDAVFTLESESSNELEETVNIIKSLVHDTRGIKFVN